MKVALTLLCFLAGVYCQILRQGNAPDEGVPIYEEIKVESVLTVRSKSGSRTGKSSSDLAKNSQNTSETMDGVNVSRRSRGTKFSGDILSPVDQTPKVSRVRRGTTSTTVVNTQQMAED